jgi:LysR family transcriptional regulator for metE and metH
MELKHFRLIKTIAEEGSIANSSEKLFLTQSALSHQLRELEEQLGFKVFFRTRNKWELSEQGQELYQLAISIFATIDEGFKSIKHINDGAKGSVKIGTECYSFYHGLPGFIQKMAILYPDIDVDIVLDATNQPIPKLLSKEIDIAIVTTKPSSDELSVIELYEDEIMCIMNKEHRLVDRPHIEASDFSNMHLIIHSFPLESVLIHEHFLKPNRSTPKKISAIPFTSVALEMINANMGVMCIPEWSLSAFKLSDQIIFKKVGQYGLKITHYLVCRSDDQSKRYVSDFISNFREEFMD